MLTKPTNQYEALLAVLELLLSGKPIPDIKTELLEIIETGHLSLQVQQLIGLTLLSIEDNSSAIHQSVLSIEDNSSAIKQYNKSTAYSNLAIAESNRAVVLSNKSIELSNLTIANNTDLTMALIQALMQQAEQIAGLIAVLNLTIEAIKMLAQQINGIVAEIRDKMGKTPAPYKPVFWCNALHTWVIGCPFHKPIYGDRCSYTCLSVPYDIVEY